MNTQEAMPWRRYRPYRDGEFVVIFCDTAAGGGDRCAGQFLSKTYLDVPTVYHSDLTATEMTPQIKIEAERIFDETHVKPIVAYERNNGGGFEMDRLASLNRLGKFDIYTMKTIGTDGKMIDTGKYGWDTNTATRPKMLIDGKEMIEKHLVTLYDRPTVNEMFSFIVVKTNSSWKAEAEVGAHDDLIMALFGAWQIQQTEQPKMNNNQILHNLPKDDVPPGMQLGNVTHNTRGANMADSSDPFGRQQANIYRYQDVGNIPNDDIGADLWR